jgi:hypothetical protein
MEALRRPKATIPTTPITTQTTTRTNNPPVPSVIGVNPGYINPTTEYVVQLTHDSYDPDGDPLTTTWLIDGKEVSHEHDYSTKLPEGEHWIGLLVSDGREENSAGARITVEPDQIFPVKQLHVRHKGISYSAATLAPGWPITMPGKEEMDEQLHTIHRELNCNAIIISAGGGYEDKLIECGRLAIEKGFDRIYISPRYVDATVEETVKRVGEFAKKARSLREISEAIVFMIGHEFGIETYGITPGHDWIERATYQTQHSDWLTRVQRELPVMFKEIIALCKENYGYQIAYAAAAWEADFVPWSDPVFESVCTNAYLMNAFGWTENWVLQHLSALRRYRKPVNSSEWGCMTFSGAGEVSAAGPLYAEQNPYDEQEQADYIKRYCDILNRARISGAFYTQIDDERLKGYGLYIAGYGNASRKKGFYMYKSYQRAT